MKKSLLVLAAALVAVAAVWKLRGDSEVAHGDSLVFDRVWIDHVPKNDRDTINIFVAITEQPFGVFQAASAWKGHYESFRYEAHGDEIRILYPQSGERDRVTARARKCSESHMDFCLEIDGASRGVKRYYSRKGWEIEAGARPELVRQRIDEIAARAAE